MENNVMDQGLDWDAEIQKESEFVLLPAGDYEFTVKGFERKRFDGSKKMQACNMAELSIQINSADGPAVIKHNLFLSTKTEWALSAFFAAIGQKKKGEVLKMNWNLVPGSRGRCKVIQEEYNGNMYNKISKFYASYDNNTSYTPGQF